VDKAGVITIVSDEPYPAYSRPLISDYLASPYPVENMLYRTPDFYKKNKIKTILGDKAVGVKPAQHTVKLASGKVIHWQKLLLATGGTPIIPDMEGMQLKGVFTFNKLDDAKAIDEFLNEYQRIVKAVVIGGGLIGVSVTEALVKRGVEVTIVEMKDYVLNTILDEEASVFETEALKQAGVNSLQPGIESLSTNILQLIRKGCTALQNVQLLKWASELGIELAWNFLMGFPGEEPDEYARMAEMIPALLHLQPPLPLGAGRLVGLYRFSPYFDDPEGWGITNVRSAFSYGLVYPFPEATLRRLAYHFDFDYADGRDPSTYTAPLFEMIQYWEANYCPGALTSVSNDSVLVIHDRRPGAEQARIELTGMEKAVYEYCDKAHTLQAIHGHLLELGYAVDKEALRRRLEGWVEDRLMLREGDRFLSLAVPADELAGRLSDSETIRHALAAAIADLGDTSRKKRGEQGETSGQGSSDN